VATMRPTVTTQADTGCDLKIPAHSSREVQISAPSDWFGLPPFPTEWKGRFWKSLREGGAWLGSRIRATLKDQTVDSHIRLQLCSPDCGDDSAAPSHIFRVKPRLTAFTKEKQAFWSYVVVFLTLLAGGVTSLLINFFLPMHERRVRVKQRLAEASRK